MRYLPFLAILAVSDFAFADKIKFSPDGGVKSEILSSLDSVQKTLDIAMYSYSDTSLQNKVVELAEAGVKVRLVFHKGILKPSREDCTLCDRLEDAGADVKWVSNTMHHKFAIIDSDFPSQALLTGSGNWSRSSSSRYDEDFIRSEKEELIVPFQNEFDHLWFHAREYGKDVYPELLPEGREFSENVYFTSFNMKTVKRGDVWSFRKIVREGKDGVVGKEIIKAIDAAESEILIATAHFRRDDMADALVRAEQRGVKIKLVTDQQEYNYLSSLRKCETDETKKLFDECLALKYDGIDVKYKVYSKVWNFRTALQMHSKYVVVDREVVLTGSFNWSYTAELKNFENLVRLTDAHSVEKYIENFENVWGYGAGKLAELYELVEREGQNAPCHFDPISMDYNEIKTLRSKYPRNACR